MAGSFPSMSGLYRVFRLELVPLTLRRYKCSVLWVKGALEKCFRWVQACYGLENVACFCPARIAIWRYCGLQGTWKTPSGEQRVVLKRVKPRVEVSANSDTSAW